MKAANRQLSDAYSSEAVVDVKIFSPASAKSGLEELSDRSRHSEQCCLLAGDLQLQGFQFKQVMGLTLYFRLQKSS